MKYFSQKIYYIAPLLVCVFSAQGGFAYSAQSDISTKVSANANSGGNRAQTVGEGAARVEVYITQEIDGVPQKPIDIVETVSEGSVVREIEMISPDGNIKTSVRAGVNVDGEKEIFMENRSAPREDALRAFLPSAVYLIVFLWSSVADYMKLLFS